VQLGLPVKVVVFNNSSLGFIEIEQKSSGFLETGTSFKNPNFAAMAEAVGVCGASGSKRQARSNPESPKL
jgi:pyruvate dehydrogenase (quinone)